jgi:hypothetical protein
MGRPKPIQSRDVVFDLWSDRGIFHRLTVHGTLSTIAASPNLAKDALLSKTALTSILSAIAFHEKAGRSQVGSFVFF